MNSSLWLCRAKEGKRERERGEKETGAGREKGIPYRGQPQLVGKAKYINDVSKLTFH